MPATLTESLFSGTIPRLNGLRAISAFLVVAYHYGIDLVGGFGSLAFFVTSGFLITWLLLAEHARSGTVSLRSFYSRRSWRIFPAFYVYWTLVTSILVLGHKHILWPQAWSSFFFVSNYYQGLNNYPSSAYSHTWSLAIQEQFYLLWPVIFLFFVSSKTKLLGVVTASIGTVWIYRAALHFHGFPEEYIYTAFETRIDHILMGCALAIALHERFLCGLWATLTRPGWWIANVILLSVSVVCANTCGPMYRNVLGFIIEPVLIAILIVQLLASRSPLVLWLDSKPLVFLGTISYSTYLYQQILISPVRAMLRLTNAPELLVFAVCVLTVWMVAWLSYMFVERPFVSLRRRFSSDGRDQRVIHVVRRPQHAPAMATEAAVG